ncbi:MAG: AAA family ATPase [Acidobacteriota bacterium]
MADANRIFEVLAKWNRWAGVAADTGFPRDLTRRILLAVGGPEVIALQGIRRCGKSTILFQVMDALLARGTDARDILYINFDEPLFAARGAANVLPQLYEIYRERLNPDRHAYVFLDEVQLVPEWEKWVRSIVDLKEAKVIVTGSSSRLLSQEYSGNGS